MNENGWAKMTRKLKEEPLIPLGTLPLTLLPPAPPVLPSPATHCNHAKYQKTTQLTT